jgi:glutaredoxin
MKQAVFYHAGCPVCNTAEQEFVQALDPSQYQVQEIHLGEDKSKIAEAESVGVKSVPALVIDKNPFHINFGASIEDLK